MSISSTSLSPASSAFELRGALTDPAHRLAFRLAWVKLNDDHTRAKRQPGAGTLPCRMPIAAALYCLALGRDVNRAFTPITNPVKLANGQRPHHALQVALLALAGRRARPELDALLTWLDLPEGVAPLDVAAFTARIALAAAAARADLPA